MNTATPTIDLDNATLTESILRQLGVTTWTNDTVQLLPFVQITPLELRAMDEAIGMSATSRELSIGIGTGVNYAVSHSGKHGGFVKVIYRAQSSMFNLPLTVEIWTSYEPEAPGDHYESCPYATEEWPKDDNGESYWVYDFEDDDFSTRHYEPECNCDYVEGEMATIIVNEPEDLALVTAKVEEMWSKL